LVLRQRLLPRPHDIAVLILDMLRVPLVLPVNDPLDPVPYSQLVEEALTRSNLTKRVLVWLKLLQAYPLLEIQHPTV